MHFIFVWLVLVIIFAGSVAQTLLRKLSPRFILYPDIQTHPSPPRLHSHCCSDCLAHYSEAGFKIFPPPVQICSTLKWISLLHLSSLLTGMWIILTGPVWSLFNLSPWFRVFLEQEGGVSHCGLWCKPGAWPSLADVQGCGGTMWAKRWNLLRVAPLGSDYLAVAVLTASACHHVNTHHLHLGWSFPCPQINGMCVFLPGLCVWARLGGRRWYCWWEVSDAASSLPHQPSLDIISDAAAQSASDGPFLPFSSLFTGAAPFHPSSVRSPIQTRPRASFLRLCFISSAWLKSSNNQSVFLGVLCQLFLQ